MPEAAPAQMAPLPMFPEEMAARGWDALDVLLVTGDAYVDHPAFGVALLGRWLEAHGFRVGIIAQPDWKQPEAVQRLGRPRLFAGVTAGALDSMLAHYTAFRKKRREDAYTPGGQSGARPNRATLVYTGLVRQAFPGLPVVIGGIEASLRRTSHYDFWSDALRRSILLDSKADLLVAGMGEASLLGIAEALAAGRDPRGVPGVAFALKKGEGAADFAGEARVRALPSHEEITAERARLIEATRLLEAQAHDGEPWLMQASGGRQVLLPPLPPPLSQAALDRLYALPFTRQAHPVYADPIPAEEMIRFSITAHRGCGGGCAFCSLALHQGRRIQSRSADSITAEAQALTEHPAFRGSISDIGGPTANMWGARCTLPKGRCQRESCLAPQICPHFKVDQSAWLRLLDRVAKLPGVKHLRVASGLRYDLALTEEEFARAFVQRYVGGQLKVAPEHSEDAVLARMRKPGFAVFERFLRFFTAASKAKGREQYLIPYLMSALPGCRDEEMRRLKRWLDQHGWRPQQVQCFIPTPGTLATAMYYAGVDTQGRPIPVARSDADRLRQHRILMGGSAPGRAQGPGKETGPRPEKRSQPPKRAGSAQRRRPKAR